MKNTNSCESLWGYVVVASKFVVLFLDTGIAKSFGVLIPMMVVRFDSDYATIGLICSMPATMTYLIAPLVSFVASKLNNRIVAMSGGLLTGFSIAATAFTNDLVSSGIFLLLSGIGFCMVYVPTLLAVNEYFPERFVFMNTLTCYGFTAGSMLLPVVTEHVFEAYGYTGALVILGGITFHLVVCGATLRKAPRNAALSETATNQCEESDENPCLHACNESDQVANHYLDRTEDRYDQHNSMKRSKVHTHSSSSSCQPPDESSPMMESSGETHRRSCKLLNERLFFISLPINFFVFYTMYAWMLFLIPHAKHLGIAESRAVFLSTIGGIGGIMGRTFFLVLIRQGFDILIVYTVAGAACAISFWLDFIGRAYWVRGVLAFVQGFCFFIEDSIGATLSKYVLFDVQNFNLAVTITLVVVGAGTSFAGLFTGYLFDITHSFTTVFIIIGTIQAIAVIILIVTTILLKKWHLQ